VLDGQANVNSWYLPETELEVLVDLPGHVVDLGESTVPIATHGGTHTWIGEIRPPVTVPQEAWVSIYSYGRFVQAVSAADAGSDERSK
jgi:hypothetical protein